VATQINFGITHLSTLLKEISFLFDHLILQ
jgi:hypothetical protein